METKNELSTVNSYKEQVQILKAEQKKTAPDEILSVFIEEQHDMIQSEIGKNALRPGSVAPLFILPNAAGKLISLKDALAKGNVVLTFYRGTWCPFCNLQLRMYQEILPEIKALGASLIAVSPMTPDNSLTFKEKHSLEFEVLSDHGNVTSSKYGIVYTVLKKAIDVTLKMGVNTPSVFNDTDKWELPLPATFILDKEGVIIARFLDKDYTKRMEPKEILNILEQIKK
jgi:peroxiredoxin